MKCDEYHGYGLLGIAELIARKDTRRSLRQQKQEERVLHLPVPKHSNRFLSRRSLRPAVPAIIIFRAVLVMFSVRLIMLPVVGYQILERKTILIGYTIEDTVFP